MVDAQRTATMTDLQDYTALRAETDSDDLAWHLHLDRLALRSEAELRWLDRVERRLDEQPPTTGDDDSATDSSAASVGSESATTTAATTRPDRETGQ